MSTSLDGNASIEPFSTEPERIIDTRAFGHDGIVQATQQQQRKHTPQSNYAGFVAGVFSGIAKLSVGHPFDTIKVRLQTSQNSQFDGPLECLMKTVKNEGLSGLYKGATPPLIGWMFMDSLYVTSGFQAGIGMAEDAWRGMGDGPAYFQLTERSMLGSLTLYRRLLNENVFNAAAHREYTEPLPRLPTIGHAMAGVLAGATVSFIAAPVEHVKARLQVQYQADKAQRLYSGPIDCTRNLLTNHGIRGLYHGLGATLLFRSFFFFWWGSYDLFTRGFQNYTNLSTPSINFYAGGLSAQVFWLTCYPTDVVKQRIMTDALGPNQKYPRWRDAARAVYRERGWRGYWRGFLPCFLRSFPANAAALTAFEGVMRFLNTRDGE